MANGHRLAMNKFIPLITIFASLVFSIAPACQPEDDDDTDDDADAPCDNSDAPEGTWVDSNTCLMWQIEGGHHPRENETARRYCEILQIGGFNDWRLPSISELRTLVRGCLLTGEGGNCPVEDDCSDEDICDDASCKGCEAEDGPGPAGCYISSKLTYPCDTYWSSTPVSGSEEYYWTIYFTTGDISSSRHADHTDEGDPIALYARCVRGV